MKPLTKSWAYKEDPFALEVSIFFHCVHMSEPNAVGYFLHLATPVQEGSWLRELGAATELKVSQFKEAFRLIRSHYKEGEIL